MFPQPHGRKLIFLEFSGSGMQVKDGQNTVSTPKYKEKEEYHTVHTYRSNILFPLPSYPKKLELSIDLDEIKRKFARIYVVFSLKNYKDI